MGRDTLFGRDAVVRYKWNITISKNHFRSSAQAILEIGRAIPVNGDITTQDAKDNWIFGVPSQIESRAELEKKLLAAGIPATARLLRPAEQSEEADA